MFVSVITSRRMRPRMAWMPTAATVPSSVASAALARPRMTLLSSRPRRAAVGEEVEVVGEREALEFREVLAVVERADKEHDHRRVEEEVDEEGPDLAEAFQYRGHLLVVREAVHEADADEHQDHQYEAHGRAQVLVEVALNWRSMMSPIMMSPVPAELLGDVEGAHRGDEDHGDAGYDARQAERQHTRRKVCTLSQPRSCAASISRGSSLAITV